MAFDTNGTKLANLIDPQVLAAMFEKKLIKAIKFAPLASVNTELQGRPGDTLTIPTYNYIGAAADVTEAADMTVAQLTATSTPVKVKKIGKAVEITDEAMLSGYGNPVDEAASQLVKAIADKVDTDLIAVLNAYGATYYKSTNTAVSVDDIQNALEKFGEDIEGAKALVVDPATYTVLRKAPGYIPNTEVAANIVVRGYVGQMFGCDVIVSERITDKHAFIVKPGALGLLLKRDTQIETDRDILAGFNVIAANKHYAAYLRDASKAITIRFDDPAQPSA